MLNDRNRNITVKNKKYQHITVTGLIGDDKDTPAKRIKAEKMSSKDSKRKIVLPKKNLKDTLGMQDSKKEDIIK